MESLTFETIKRQPIKQIQNREERDTATKAQHSQIAKEIYGDD